MLLGRRDRETTHVRLRGHHPLRPGIQSRSPRTPFYHSRRARRGPDARSRNTACATPDGYHTHTVWPHPLSLATTHGVSFPAGTEMFHFPAYPRPRRCRPMTAGGFPHSEILGSKPCWRLPEAYRSLTRPSSVLSAKASTIRPSRATTRPPATKPANTGQQIFALMITKRSEQRTKPLQEEVRPKKQ